MAERCNTPGALSNCYEVMEDLDAAVHDLRVQLDEAYQVGAIDALHWADMCRKVSEIEDLIEEARNPDGE